MKIVIKGFITCKQDELYSDCRDNYAVNTAHHKFGISDGVSKSFFPGIWSELLVKNFVTDTTTVVEEWIRKCQEEWHHRVKEVVDLPTTKYYTRNAFNRDIPGLATFTGLQFHQKEAKWEAWALGDSFIFFIPEECVDLDAETIIVTSKKAPYLFDNFPDYYASIGHQHVGEVKNIIKDLVPGTFYLMTDAMAEWFLKDKKSAVECINVWHDQSHFHRNIKELRIQEQITNDDCSILIIQLFAEGNAPNYNYDKPDVCDLKELIEQESKEQEQKEQGEPKQLSGIEENKIINQIIST